LPITKVFTFAQNCQKKADAQVEPAASPKVFKMSNIEHFLIRRTLHYVAVKTKELTLKQTFSVPLSHLWCSDRGTL